MFICIGDFFFIALNYSVCSLSHAHIRLALSNNEFSSISTHFLTFTAVISTYSPYLLKKCMLVFLLSVSKYQNTEDASNFTTQNIFQTISIGHLLFSWTLNIVLKDISVPSSFLKRLFLSVIVLYKRVNTHVTMVWQLQINMNILSLSKQ